MLFFFILLSSDSINCLLATVLGFFAVVVVVFLIENQKRGFQDLEIILNSKFQKGKKKNFPIDICLCDFETSIVCFLIGTIQQTATISNICSND